MGARPFPCRKLCAILLHASVVASIVLCIAHPSSTISFSFNAFCVHTFICTHNMLAQLSGSCHVTPVHCLPPCHLSQNSDHHRECEDCENQSQRLQCFCSQTCPEDAFARRQRRYIKHS
eukprot:TRINITY_DN48013_c0_g1_i2.p1 TRINITY_DN48013_c0_g1~~TRINITY_DN48013_c0_g1_i2.p1  ORF type:complete len:119 (+),score=1.70 TRINITY_DN48013_c0_g1_i2:81-437(+)